MDNVISRVYQTLKEGSYTIDEISEILGINRSEAGGAVLVLRSGYGISIRIQYETTYSEEGVPIGIPKYSIKD